MNDICILVTGGTIDKEHDPITETLVFTSASHLAQMLGEFRVRNIPFETLMLKDSLDMTDADRKIILDAVLKRPENLIVITHGTSTMPETAEYLKDRVGGKTVVLTGAMRPFSLLRSEAGFNLGSAITAAQLAKPGVYIAMNGRLFEAGKVRKDTDTGYFEDRN